jgi:hypothetical protein
MSDIQQTCGTPQCANPVTVEDRDRFIRQWKLDMKAKGVDVDASGGGPMPRPFYCKSCLDTNGVPA